MIYRLDNIQYSAGRTSDLSIDTYIKLQIKFIGKENFLGDNLNVQKILL